MVIIGKYDFNNLNDSEFIRILTIESNNYYLKFGKPVIILCNRRVNLTIKAYLYFYLGVNCNIFNNILLNMDRMFIIDDVLDNDEYVLGDYEGLKTHIKNKYRYNKIKKINENDIL